MGVMLRWVPGAQTYLKGGLFMAYPDATSSSNNGLWFGGNPSLKDQTGLMSMVEIGWLPKLESAKLQGRYALGGYTYNNRTSERPAHHCQLRPPDGPVSTTGPASVARLEHL